MPRGQNQSSSTGLYGRRTRYYAPNSENPTDGVLQAAVADAASTAHAEAYTKGYLDGFHAYANAIRPGLLQLGSALLTFGSTKYALLRRLLATGSSRCGAPSLYAANPAPPAGCGALHVSTIPTYEDVRAVEAAGMLRSHLQHSYGHREKQACQSLAKKLRCGQSDKLMCSSPNCVYEASTLCPHTLCALHCDKRWAAANTDAAAVCTAGFGLPLPSRDSHTRGCHVGAENCARHQPKGHPSTLGSLVLDGYEAQVDDPCAWLTSWLNGEQGDAMLKRGLRKEVCVQVASLLHAKGGALVYSP